MNYTMRECSANLGLRHTIAISSRCVDVVVRVELRGLGGFDLATTGVQTENSGRRLLWSRAQIRCMDQEKKATTNMKLYDCLIWL
jgi:hypothetical protein